MLIKPFSDSLPNGFANVYRTIESVVKYVYAFCLWSVAGIVRIKFLKISHANNICFRLYCFYNLFLWFCLQSPFDAVTSRLSRILRFAGYDKINALRTDAGGIRKG